jgi:hypothetical protein
MRIAKKKSRESRRNNAVEEKTEQVAEQPTTEPNEKDLDRELKNLEKTSSQLTTSTLEAKEKSLAKVAMAPPKEISTSKVFPSNYHPPQPTVYKEERIAPNMTQIRQVWQYPQRSLENLQK